MQSQNDRMISVHFQGKSFIITVIQAYAPTSNAEEAEIEQFYEDIEDLLELTPKEDILFRGYCPWRKKWQPTPVFLPGESHGQRSWQETVHGVAESDTTE